LFKTAFSSPTTHFGKINEPVAIKLLERVLNKKNQPAGIFIHKYHGYLAAAPDGMLIKIFKVII